MGCHCNKSILEQELEAVELGSGGLLPPDVPQSELVAPPAAGRREWTDEELQYSIVISPTSPGDSRFRIPARSRRPSSLQFPFNTICFLEMTDAAGNRFTGSGTLIAPQVVLTAKHCLQDVAPPRCARSTATGTPYVRVQVTPGADLSAAAAGDQRPADPGSQVATPARFRVDPELDYGVIILPSPFRRPTQFMRLQPRSDPGTATLLTIAGYPCDKPRGTMWGHSERILLSGVTATHLIYPIDTCPGHSGSPVWLLGNSGIRLLLGVHTSGAVTGAGRRCENDPSLTRCVRTGAPTTAVAGDNCGVRVTCDLIDNILGWCREFRVSEPQVDAEYRRRCPSRPVAPIGPRPTVRRGSRGSAVVDLQSRLNVWIARNPGLGLAPLAVDGILGPKTDAAVRAFQRAGGLLVDGIVGPQTWGALLVL